MLELYYDKNGWDKYIHLDKLHNVDKFICAIQNVKYIGHGGSCIVFASDDMLKQQVIKVCLKNKMRKVLIIINVVFLFWNCQGQKKTNKTDVVVEKQTIYQFKVQDLSGKQFDFATLKGKKIMIVNTASKCGLTPQYKELEAIYKEYSSKDFVIVGFPANNFAGQEPGTNEEIKQNKRAA